MRNKTRGYLAEAVTFIWDITQSFHRKMIVHMCESVTKSDMIDSVPPSFLKIHSYLGLHFGSKKTEFLDESLKIIDIFPDFFVPKWSSTHTPHPQVPLYLPPPLHHTKVIARSPARALFTSPLCTKAAVRCTAARPTCQCEDYGRNYGGVWGFTATPKKTEFLENYRHCIVIFRTGVKPYVGCNQSSLTYFILWI